MNGMIQTFGLMKRIESIAAVPKSVTNVADISRLPTSSWLSRSQSVGAISPGGRLGASLIALVWRLAESQASTRAEAPSSASNAARMSTCWPTKIGVSRSV
jgi:hypothetical protein